MFKGRIIYSNGDKFEGHFSMGQIEGKGKLTCVNGVMYDGDWKHSQVLSYAVMPCVKIEFVI